MASVEMRLLDRRCYVEGEFMYEYDVLMGALDDLYATKKLQLTLRPTLREWLLKKGLISNSRKSVMGHALIDVGACMALSKHVEACADVHFAEPSPLPTEGGPYLCVITYLNDGGWVSRQWEILSWYHTAEKGDCWNLEAFDGGTEVVYWRNLPDYPGGV